MWTELFMSHVRLVTRAKGKKQKAPKSSAVRAICNDIIGTKSKK